ncbi:MAG: hypothetical protein J1G05_02710 [Clostridiales bacterium]|nr:hypothetical protein [Clostridiales bacterium]
MNKKLGKILSCGVCLTMAAVFTAGCTPGATTGTGANPETRPFVMAIGATDGNFSPFFATAQYDTQVTELTQISMLNADAKGNIAYGENEPTVVLDMKETLYEDKEGTIVSTSGSMNGKSVYQFVIKNGIKFSNGSYLTIKDVLFNLYVYLDPVYFGSSTIYSTDIIGLAAYRNQDPTADADSDISGTFDADAQTRINQLMEYLEDGTIMGTTEAQLKEDIELLKKLYREEVESDWTSVYGTLDSYTKEYRFTKNWEIYYFNEGLISVLYDLTESGNRVERKDADGKYLTSLDEKDESGNDKTDFREEMEAALNDESKISAAMTKYDCTREEALGYVERDTAIDRVYSTKTASNLTLLSILTEGWASASNLRDKFAKEAMSDYFENNRKDDGSLVVPNISGITTYKTSNFNGKNLGETHDVLQVEINGVDPKAIWNMAFQVAPAYYYSGVFNNVDYRNIDIAQNQFGVCFGNSTFFDTILGSTDKSKLPVGAGAYKASTKNGGDAPNGDVFHNNKVSYYVRNDYFETVGKGISNAKIKYVRYREVEDASLVQVLKTGEVDYGEPNCTPENIAALPGGAVTLGYQTPKSSGYGYVGINPKYIPDINVRRAIIRAMNIGTTIRFYTEEYAEELHRPMSTANWVYDYIKNDGAYYNYESDPAKIKASLKGWDFSSGVGKKDGYTLKYTFTIAGGTTDHPAYAMFNDAAKILNNAGFDISVTTDNNALKSLATGSLAVWAAAYTSPIDPDLYQLYHKDSKATNVKNWGYDVIKQNTNNLYTYEKGVLEDLSDLIIEARQTTSQMERGAKYKDALDLIMELAIQLPTYQRNDLVVYNRILLDGNTLNKSASAYAGVLNRIWEVNYSK